ncbi:hypothetical protein BJ944DRAFT_265774 [Cunninghamella echinulata]|nr:hypothetical protein BJ944DRAFT_265774 [Cunninghamella echinulata]
MKATFIILTILIALASCQQNIVSITSPLSNSQYTAGEKLIISWINPTVQTIPSITLVNGPATALQPVSTIAQNVDANSGSYSWSIPADITPGRYALQLGTSPSISYSGFFTINAANGGSSNGGGKKNKNE